MSLIKFELKNDHLKLLRFLQWSKTDTNHILSINSLDRTDAEEVILTPFGGDNLIEDIGNILYGRPADENIIPISESTEIEVIEGEIVVSDNTFGYTPEQISEMTQLFYDLPTALNICLYTQSFELGHYKRRYHDIDWVKYEPK